MDQLAKNDDEISELRKERDQLKQQLAQWKQLETNPVATHLNILHGRIQLSRDQALYIAGATDYDERCHDMKILRQAMGCDGSDLPQLLAAWDKLISQRDHFQENCVALEFEILHLTKRLTQLANESAVLCVHCDELKNLGGAFETAREFTKCEIKRAREALKGDAK